LVRRDRLKLHLRNRWWWGSPKRSCGT
jgi:hypothetical protein